MVLVGFAMSRTFADPISKDYESSRAPQPLELCSETIHLRSIFCKTLHFLYVPEFIKHLKTWSFQNKETRKHN